jgi:FtsP/CotA-like multicopper oxidase with cupredoxin domain
MLSEWYSDENSAYVKDIMRPLFKDGPIRPLANSNLINGKMKFPCDQTTLPCIDAEYAKFNFTSRRYHRLRLVNTDAGTIEKFPIDGHKMQVIAFDHMRVEP